MPICYSVWVWLKICLSTNMMENEKTGFSSLGELASAAGVSVSTVSRALAGNPVINKKTRERIVELARAHDFQPNQLARNLRLKRTQAIGVILPLGHETDQHLSDPFFLALLGSLADELTERGYDLLLSRVIPTDDRWLDRLVDSGRMDGVIIIGQSDQAEVLDRVAGRYKPMVVWGGRFQNQKHCSVGSDNILGGMLATEHLIARGRKNLLFLGDPAPPEIGQRQQGFLQACKAAGLDENVQSLSVHLTAEAAHPAILDFFAGKPKIDGIVAGSDVVAMSAIRALSEHGLVVPDDVAVTGYDDIMLAAHLSPPLTTVRQNLPNGARRLVELLFRRLEGEDAGSVVLEPELIIRGST